MPIILTQARSRLASGDRDRRKRLFSRPNTGFWRPRCSCGPPGWPLLSRFD